MVLDTVHDVSVDPTQDGLNSKADAKASNPTSHDGGDDGDDGDAWDSGSLLEELLEEADVYEYTTDGEPRSTKTSTSAN